MIQQAFDGDTVFLINEPANWASSMKAYFSRVNDVEGSKQGPESRTVLNNAIRTRVEFAITLGTRQSAEFRVSLQRLKNSKVLCPFWMGAHYYYTGTSVYIAPASGFVYTSTPTGSVFTSGTGEAPRILAGIWLTFEQNWTSFEVHTTASPTTFTPSVNAIRVPVILGYLESFPDPTPITSEWLQCTIKVKQDSEARYGLRPINFTTTGGPALGGRTPQLFPLQPNWAKPITAGGASVAVDREELGFAGQVSEVYYPQIANRGMQLGYTFQGWLEIGALISFFHGRGGQVESFWLPGALAETRLVSNSSGSSANISVDYAAALGDNVYIAFTQPGHDPVLRKVIASNTTTNVLTLDAAPGVFTPTGMTLTSLILARFQKAEIQIEFTTDLIAEATISFIETSPEYTPPTGETYGTTYGALPAKAFVYRFYRRFPTSTVIDRFTSFETDLNCGGEVFTSKKGHIEHSNITDSLDIDRSSVKIQSRAFTGNPLLLLFPNQLEVPLELEIMDCSPDTSGNSAAPRSLFVGEVSKPNQTGPRLNAEVIHKLSTLGNNVPTAMVGPSCPYKLFSAPCGLLESDWRWSAVVVSYNTSTGVLVIGTIVRTNGGSSPSFTAGWFRYGKIYGGTGTSSWVRSAYDSTAISGGQITLTLSQKLTTAPSVGSSLNLNPGCTGTVDECKNKFSNYPKNFGGSPFVPNGDPSFGDAPNTSGAGKK